MAKTFTFALAEDIRQRLDAKAQEMGISQGEVARLGIELIVNMDRALLARVRKWAAGLNVPDWMVIQNLLIKRFAEDAAEMEVWGPSRKLLDEFFRVGDRTLTGGELFEHLKAFLVKDKGEERRRWLEEKRQAGVALEPDELAFLEKQRERGSRGPVLETGKRRWVKHSDAEAKDARPAPAEAEGR